MNELRVRCEEVITRLSDFLGGELEGERRAAFERHLGRCRSCGAYLHSFRTTIAAARAVMGGFGCT
jgi:anti-sigma factor RsiW